MRMISCSFLSFFPSSVLSLSFFSSSSSDLSHIPIIHTGLKKGKEIDTRTWTIFFFLLSHIILISFYSPVLHFYCCLFFSIFPSLVTSSIMKHAGTCLHVLVSFMDACFFSRHSFSCFFHILLTAMLKWALES